MGPSHIDEERSRKKALSGIECFIWRSCFTVFYERIFLFYMASSAQNGFQQPSAQACCYVELKGRYIKQFPVASNKLKSVYITICHSCRDVWLSLQKVMTLNASTLYNKRTGLVTE